MHKLHSGQTISMLEETPLVGVEYELALIPTKSTHISNSLLINNDESDQQETIMGKIFTRQPLYSKLEEIESESNGINIQQVSCLTFFQRIFNLIVLFRNVLMKMFYFAKTTNVVDVYVTSYSQLS